MSWQDAQNYVSWLNRMAGTKLARHEMVQQADAVRLFGFDDPRREQQFLGNWPADLVRQRPGAVNPTVSRRKKTEAGILAADPHIE